MRISDIINEEKSLLERKGGELGLNDMIRLNKISEITSLYFNTLSEYSITHSICELERYKEMLDSEEIDV